MTPVGGDLSCDGILDLADLILALQISVSNPPDVFCFLDIDGDGRIGMAEALFIMQDLANLP